MYNENGVAYAPWVAKQIDEEAIVNDLIRKEKGYQYYNLYYHYYHYDYQYCYYKKVKVILKQTPFWIEAR